MVWVEKMKRGTYKFEIVFIDDSTVIFETVPNNFVRVRLSDETWEYFERFEFFQLNDYICKSSVMAENVLKYI